MTSPEQHPLLQGHTGQYATANYLAIGPGREEESTVYRPNDGPDKSSGTKTNAGTNPQGRNVCHRIGSALGDWLYDQRGRFFYVYLLIQGSFCYASILTFPVIAFVLQDAMGLSDLQLALAIAIVYAPNWFLPSLVSWIQSWLVSHSPSVSSVSSSSSSYLYRRVSNSEASSTTLHSPQPGSPTAYTGLRGVGGEPPQVEGSVSATERQQSQRDPDAIDSIFENESHRTQTIVSEAQVPPELVEDFQLRGRKAHLGVAIVSMIACSALICGLTGIYLACGIQKAIAHEGAKPTTTFLREHQRAWFHQLVFLDPLISFIEKAVEYYLLQIKANLTLGEQANHASLSAEERFAAMNLTAWLLLLISRLFFGLSHELLYYLLERLPIYQVMTTDAYTARHLRQGQACGGMCLSDAAVNSDEESEVIQSVGLPQLESAPVENAEREGTLVYPPQIATCSCIATLTPGQVLHFATQAGAVFAFYVSAIALAYFLSVLTPPGKTLQVTPENVLLSISTLWLSVWIVGVAAFFLSVILACIASIDQADAENLAATSVEVGQDSDETTIQEEPTPKAKQSSARTSTAALIMGALFGELLHEATTCLRVARKSVTKLIVMTLRCLCCCGCCGNCTCFGSSGDSIHMQTSKKHRPDDKYRRWLAPGELAAFEAAVADELVEQDQADWQVDSTPTATLRSLRAQTPLSFNTSRYYKGNGYHSPAYGAIDLETYQSKPEDQKPWGDEYYTIPAHTNTSGYFVPLPLELPPMAQASAYSASSDGAPTPVSVRHLASGHQAVGATVIINGRTFDRKSLYDAVSRRLAEHFQAVRALVFTSAVCIVLQDLYTLILHRLWGLSLFESVVISSFPSLVGLFTAISNALTSGTSQTSAAAETTDSQGSDYRSKKRKSKLHLAFVAVFAYIACMALAQDAENHIAALPPRSESKFTGLASILGHLAPTTAPSSRPAIAAPSSKSQHPKATREAAQTSLTPDVFTLPDQAPVTEAVFKHTLRVYLDRLVKLVTNGELFLLVLAMLVAAVLSSLLQKELWERVMTNAAGSLAESLPQHIIAMQSILYCVIVLLSQFFWNSFPAFVIVAMAILLVIEYVAGVNKR